MKTHFLLIYLSAFFLISSCSKEELTENQKTGSESIQYILDHVPSISNPYDVRLYTTNEENADDDTINDQLLEIAIATRIFLKESPQNQTVLKGAKASTRNTFNLFDLVSNSKLKYTNQSVSYKNLVSLLEKNALTYTSKNPLKSGELEVYKPAIYVPNAENADLSKQPIVGVGFEVNTNLSGMEKYEDYIVAWYYDNEGNLHEILLSEETSMNTSNPVFIIIADIETEETISENISEIKLTKSAISTLSSQKIIDEYKINYRYDKSNKSEYSYEIAYIYNNGGYSFGGYRTEIAEIHKDDIGKVFTNDFEIWQINYISNLHSIAIVTYEYDWYASMKTVICPNPTTGYIIFECRMSKSDEYYQRFSIQMSDNITTNYDKGYIKVKSQ